jgi:DNA-binding HxlR family transcriptional regulator
VVTASPGAGEPARSADPGLDLAVLALIGRPWVAEVLAALDQRPDTLHGLRRATGAPRGQLVAALRALAAHHAMTRTTGAGTWDATSGGDHRYQLSPGGRALIDQLFHLPVWQALYHDGPGDGPA